jgi:uncharacterized protein (TIGR03790 family)
LWAALLGCPATPAGGGANGIDKGAAGETAEAGGDTGESADTADSNATPGCLAVVTALSVEGEAIPGETVRFVPTVEGSEGSEVLTFVVTDEDGSDLGAVAADGSFVLPATLAVHEAEEVTVTARVCDSAASAAFTVDWPESERIVVVYNPSAAGSEDVARAYGEFRQIPESGLCGVESTSSDTLDGGDFESFAEAVFACVQDRTLYIAPVWGVPYKVSGRINDFASGTPTTVSLDALLFFGLEAKSMTDAAYNPLYRDGDSTTGDYKDYRTAGRNRRANDAWLVTRLDGAGADEAIALIDRTRAAEERIAAEGLTGTVYVDGRYGDAEPAADAEFGSYEWGEWNMWGTRRVFEEAALYDVVWDGNEAEFGTDPAPTACPDALYYAGWYSFYNYNDCFEWTVGAIGGHLDSCSACDIRNAGTWAGSALLDGITATYGAVNEPYVAGMPEYDQFYYYLLQGANFAEAAYESTVVGGWMMVWVGDPLYRPYAAEPVFPVE